jgi:hypothetical protein
MLIHSAQREHLKVDLHHSIGLFVPIAGSMQQLLTQLIESPFKLLELLAIQFQCKCCNLAIFTPNCGICQRT